MQLRNELPVPENPTLTIIDSTKLQSYITCPRMFFYNYILGWQTDAPNNHLVFGSAVHEAMEHLYTNGFGTDQVVDAFHRFLNCYRAEFPEETDEMFEPKTPARFMDFLLQYAQTYQTDFIEYNPLFTEIAGSVSIDGYYKLYFKMDTILQDHADGSFFSLEHKTKQGTIDRQWRMDFPLSVQVGTYTHALYCLYPISKVRGVVINGLGFKKTKSHLFEMERLPIWKTIEQMQVWQTTVLYYLMQLEDQYARLGEESDSAQTMLSFPLRPTSCTKFFGCKYHDFCCAWSNPLQRCDEPPFGFKREFWNHMAEKHSHEFHFNPEDIKEG